MISFCIEYLNTCVELELSQDRARLKDFVCFNNFDKVISLATVLLRYVMKSYSYHSYRDHTMFHHTWESTKKK